MDHFLNLPHRPTALVCYNDMMAIGVLRGLQLAGVRVPQDCSVTGFDNIVLSEYTNPPLTTFDQPKHFIGAEAARLLLGMLRTDPDKNTNGLKSQTLKGWMLARASTAPPSG